MPRGQPDTGAADRRGRRRGAPGPVSPGSALQGRRPHAPLAWHGTAKSQLPQEQPRWANSPQPAPIPLQEPARRPPEGPWHRERGRALAPRWVHAGAGARSGCSQLAQCIPLSGRHQTCLHRDTVTEALGSAGCGGAGRLRRINSDREEKWGISTELASPLPHPGCAEPWLPPSALAGFVPWH